jgi:hypothetical protein
VDFSLQKYSKKTDARFDGMDDKISILKTELKSDIKNVTEELYRVRDELKTDITNVREELGDELYRVRDELKTDINDGQASMMGRHQPTDTSKRRRTLNRNL